MARGPRKPKGKLNQPFPRESLPIARVSAVLGCAESTVRRLIHDGKLAAYRLGKPPYGSFRVTAVDLIDFRRRHLVIKEAYDE